MIVLMRRFEWLGATARQVEQDRWLAGLRQIIAQPPGVDSTLNFFFFQKPRLSTAAHEEFITKGYQVVMVRPSSYSPASVPTRQVLSFRPDI